MGCFTDRLQMASHAVRIFFVVFISYKNDPFPFHGIFFFWHILIDGFPFISFCQDGKYSKGPGKNHRNQFQNSFLFHNNPISPALFSVSCQADICNPLRCLLTIKDPLHGFPEGAFASFLDSPPSPCAFFCASMGRRFCVG